MLKEIGSLWRGIIEKAKTLEMLFGHRKEVSEYVLISGKTDCTPINCTFQVYVLFILTSTLTEQTGRQTILTNELKLGTLFSLYKHRLYTIF